MKTLTDEKLETEEDAPTIVHLEKSATDHSDNFQDLQFEDQEQSDKLKDDEYDELEDDDDLQLMKEMAQEALEVLEMQEDTKKVGFNRGNDKDDADAKKKEMRLDDSIQFLMQQKKILGKEDFDKIFRKPNVMGPEAYFQGRGAAAKYFQK